jgi:hypothetical protein
MIQRDIEFLRRLLADRPESRAQGVSATKMAQEHHVGRIDGRKVAYCETDFIRAENLLRSRGIPLEVPETYTRSQAPAGQSEKHRAIAVTDGLVAVRGVNMPALELPEARFLAMHWESAIKLDFDVLLVVENLEALIRIDEYRWMDQFVKGRRALAVFHGAPVIFTTKIAARLINSDVRPTLAFFDFDPKGLGMAASLLRREALCIPDIQVLIAEARRQNRKNLYFQSADSSGAQLDKVQDPAIALAWRAMKSETVGLDQEHFPV